MATELLYLKDFDIEHCTAVVQSITPAEDGRKAVVLDATCFYPRGGGQDWDLGTIINKTMQFDVDEVRLDADGTVQHIGAFTVGEFAAGDTVQCAVDHERRHANTQLHSAGHLLDMAVDQLGWPWTPGRGAHYPHMSFVEYATDVAIDEQAVQALQRKIDELRTSTYTHQIVFVPVAEMAKYCRHVPDNIPTNKPARLVLYAEDFGIPCGGTHVRRASDIDAITVTKIKAKNGLVKVSYTVKGIN